MARQEERGALDLGWGHLPSGLQGTALHWAFMARPPGQSKEAGKRTQES